MTMPSFPSPCLPPSKWGCTYIGPDGARGSLVTLQTSRSLKEEMVQSQESPRSVPRCCIHSRGLTVLTPFWALRFGVSLLHALPAVISLLSQLSPPRIPPPCPCPELPISFYFTAWPDTHRRGSKGYSQGPRGLLAGQGSPWVQVALPYQGVPVAPAPPAGVQRRKVRLQRSSVSPNL